LIENVCLQKNGVGDISFFYLNPDYSLTNLKGKSKSEELFYSQENQARLFYLNEFDNWLLLIFS
jgi:hypothetical protein